MMRFLVLCGLALAVAAAPYLKQKAAQANVKHTVEKRADEKIIYGNHQNSARMKKADPAMKTKVKVEQAKVAAALQKITAKPPSDAVKPVKTLPVVINEVGKTKDKSEDNDAVRPTADVVVLGKQPQNDDSSNLKQLLLADRVVEEATGGDAKTAGNKMSNAMIQRVYGRRKYVPYNSYYYDALRQAFRRKRRAASPKQTSSAKRSRSKRDLGYTGEYYPYQLDDGDERDLEDEEISSLLAPYIKDALQERYGDEALTGEDDGTYGGRYAGNEVEWQDPERDSAEMDELVDSYLRAYPFSANDEGYGPAEKRSGLLGMMPGNRRKRFEYPYSLEPQGHWGAFVPGAKRNRYDDTYDKLYELAAILARRNAYSSYLDALEAYKK